MDAEEIARLIAELENRVERLRALYDQYFMGIERIEPLIMRKDVDRRLWALRREQIRNTGLRFKLETTIQRYNTYQQYWQRIVREIEAGTYQRDFGRAAQRFGDNVVTAFARRRQKMFEKGLSEKAERNAQRRPEEDAGEAPPAEADEPLASSETLDVPFEAPDSRHRTPAREAAPAEPIEPLELDIGPPPAPMAPSTEGRSSIAGPAKAPSTVLSTARAPLPAAAISAAPGKAPPAITASPGNTPPTATPFPLPGKAPLAGAAAPGKAPLAGAAAPGKAPLAGAGSPGKAPLPGAALPGKAAPVVTGSPVKAPPVPVAASGAPMRPLAPRPPIPAPSNQAAPIPAPKLAAPALPVPAPIASRGNAPSIVEGTAPRAPSAAESPRVPLARPVAASRPDVQSAAVASEDNGLSPIRLRQIYGAFVEAKRRANESTASVTFEKIASNLENVAKELRAKHKAKSVDFEVVMKNGKPVLKPVVKG